MIFRRPEISARSILISLIGVFAGTSACTRAANIPASQIPSTQPATRQPIPGIPKSESPSRSWQFSPTSELHRYNTVITTTIQLSAEAGQVVDSLVTRAQYDLSITRTATSTSLTGSITSFGIQTGNHIGANTIIPALPITFAGQIQNHQLQLDVTANNRSAVTSLLPCEEPARNTLTTVQRNLFLPPLQLQAGSTWQDSVSSTSCNGELTLNLTVVRTYKVIDEISLNGISVIAVDMTEKALSTGEGSQDQHRLTIHSETTRSGRLYLDAITGLLVSLSSEIHTTLQIQSSGRSEQFFENSRETTTQM